MSEQTQVKNGLRDTLILWRVFLRAFGLYVLYAEKFVCRMIVSHNVPYFH